MEQVQAGSDVFFVLMGAVMVLAMHCGFAFLEVGTVRRKNQVNALVKILVDLSVSTVAYFFIGYMVAYGTYFLANATVLTGAAAGEGYSFGHSGYDLVKFFFLMTFAAAIPAIISGGIAERARFGPQAVASAVIVGVIYPFYEGMVWGGRFGLQDWMESTFGYAFHDFAGSIVVHAMGGWIALAAVILLGARQGRYRDDGRMIGIPPSNVPFLALGSWILSVGGFGFNVMSAQSLDSVTGLVAINSLMAMVGGILAAFVVGCIFLNRAHFDLFYHWVALVVAFTAIARRHLAEPLRYPTRPGGAGKLRRMERRGLGMLGVKRRTAFGGGA